MTHWEYPQALERFGRQLDALGISAELQARGAQDGDLVMIDKFDFDFAPGMTNIYIPPELLEDEFDADDDDDDDEEAERPWRPYAKGGFLDEDMGELIGFGESEDWDQLEDDFDEDQEFVFSDDEIWSSQSWLKLMMVGDATPSDAQRTKSVFPTAADSSFKIKL